MPKKILVVDDSMSTREHIIAYCQKLNDDCIFVQAHDGEDGYRALVENKKNIDLIISDQNMPRMTGLEFLKKIKEQEQFKKIPFVIATSSTDKSLILEALNLGASDFITKPFEEELLLKKLERLLI